MKKVTLKITSYILVIVCCFSTAAIGITSASAVNSEDAVKDIAIQTINQYADNLADVVGKVPYIGDACKILFQYLAKGVLPQKEEVNPFVEVNNKLDEIKSKINGMSVQQDLAENKTFNSLCDVLSAHCTNADTFVTNIQTAKDSLKLYQDEREKLDETTDKERIDKLDSLIDDCNTTISKNQSKLVDLVTDVKDSNSMTNTIANIEKYITNQSTGQDKNPLKNYFEAQNKKLHFASDALKASQVYESKIISTYTHAIATRVRTLTEMCEMTDNESEINNLTVEAKKVIDTSEKVLEYYNSIAQEEQNSTNKYYDSEGNSISIERIGKAEITNLKLQAMGDYAQLDMLRGLNNYKDVFPLSSTDEKLSEYVDKYMEKINSIIQTEYTDFENYTLRDFLNSKGFSVPDDAKYLIAGKLYKWGYMGYNTKIPVYELDKATNTYKSGNDGFTVGIYSTPINSKELCYFIEKSSGSTEEGGADLIIDGYATHYSKIADAWSEAVTTKQGENITIKLNEDWNAIVNADGYTYFGKGNGFKNGAIYVNMHDNVYLTLDLNGYTIDRKLKAPREDGSVIIVEYGYFKITDSSGTNMGTITGGNTTGNGGGIQQLNFPITVENCKITNNYAEGNGGGVSVEYNNFSLYNPKNPTSDLHNTRFYNVEITNNKSKLYGGGISTKLNGETEITLGGRVIINNNYYANGVNNDCFLEDGYVHKVTIRINNDNPLTSDSTIGIISNTNDRWLRITEKANKFYGNNFFYNYNDNSKYRISSEGSGDSQVLYIKK